MANGKVRKMQILLGIPTDIPSFIVHQIIGAVRITYKHHQVVAAPADGPKPHLLIGASPYDRRGRELSLTEYREMVMNVRDIINYFLPVDAEPTEYSEADFLPMLNKKEVAQ